MQQAMWCHCRGRYVSGGDKLMGSRQDFSTGAAASGGNKVPSSKLGGATVEADMYLAAIS